MGTQGQQLSKNLGDEAYVQKAYQSTLGRVADSAGLRNYLDRLRAGVTRAQIWSELAASDEAKRFSARQSVVDQSRKKEVNRAMSLAELLAMDGSEFVQQAYRLVLGREADPTGLHDYTQRLAEGASQSQLLADLRCDPEGQAFDSKLAGLNDWVKLVQQQGSISDLLLLQGELFVYGAYVALFRRDPDPEGLSRYMELMKAGSSRTFILMELLNSPEAREKSASLRGLVNAIAVYKIGQRRTWRGWYFRNVLGVESDLPSDQERRAAGFRSHQ